MTVHNPLAGVATRTARWSAEHPWRAILGWLALVAVAVGLAIAVPTAQTNDADYRLGESGRADALVHRAGLDVPRDFSLTGVIADRLADDFHPPLTAADVPAGDMARLAVDLLLEQIGDPSATPRHSMLAPPITLRSSTGARRRG